MNDYYRNSMAALCTLTQKALVAAVNQDQLHQAQDTFNNTLNQIKADMLRWPDGKPQRSAPAPAPEAEPDAEPDLASDEG